MYVRTVNVCTTDGADYIHVQIQFRLGRNSLFLAHNKRQRYSGASASEKLRLHTAEQLVILAGEKQTASKTSNIWRRHSLCSMDQTLT